MKKLIFAIMTLILLLYNTSASAGPKATVYGDDSASHRLNTGVSPLFMDGKVLVECAGGES